MEGLIYVDTPNGMRYVRTKEWEKHKKRMREQKLRDEHKKELELAYYKHEEKLND